MIAKPDARRPTSAPADGPAPPVAGDEAESLHVAGMSLHGLRARLVRAVSWNLVATAFTQGSTLALNLILSNSWPMRAFGQYAIVQSTLTTLTAVAQPTTGTTATKYVAELRGKDPQRAGRILSLCAAVSLAFAILCGGVLLIGAQPIATRILGEPDLAGALAVASVVVFFAVMSAFLSGALAGLEAYPALGRTGIVSGIASVTISAAAGLTWGLAGAVSGLAISAALQWAMLLSALRSNAARQGIRVVLREGWHELGVFFRFVTPAGLNGLAAYPAIWFGNAFLVQHADGLHQMAIFAVANSFRILVVLLPTIVNNVTMSLLNNQRGAAHEQRYRRVFWTNVAMSAALVFTGAGVVALAGPWLLGLFGEGFRSGYRVLLILMAATLPETIANATTQILQSRERMWLSFLGVVLPGYVVLTVVARMLTPIYGAEGLAWSYVASMTTALVASVWIVRRLGVWDATKPAVAAVP